MHIIGDRRETNRRAADERNEHMKGALLLGFILTLLTGISLGYYLAAAEAARIVIEASK